MKIRDLADIKEGLKILPANLRKEKRNDGIYFQCIQASDFSDGQSFYIPQKDLRKLPGFSTKSFLFYGDYILYKKDDQFKLYRYDNTSGQTIASNGLFVITPEIGILKDFFSFEKNRQYFFDELKKKEQEGPLTVEKIGEIEILTDNILELETANKAEQIGIREPIKFSDVPFNIYQKPLPIASLLKRIELGELLLDADFQRRPGLWDISVKSRLIESMIIRLPIPAFYFDGSNDSQWLVIDGLQRLSAVNDFINSKYVLTGLDYLPELESKSFSDLDRIHQRNIEEFEIFAYIIQKGTPKNVTYKIFKNINTSALKLEPQEIRHALNPGDFATLLKETVEKEWFSICLLLTDRNKERMEDRELILRFCAFQISRYSEYTPTIVEFLDTAMTKMYSVPSYKQQFYIQELEDIFNILYLTLGVNAFSRSLFDDSRKYGHNNVMFELLTYGVSIVPKEKRKIITDPKSNFRQIVIDHFSSKRDGFWEYESTYSQENLRKRFEEIELLFKKLIQ